MQASDRGQAHSPRLLWWSSLVSLVAALSAGLITSDRASAAPLTAPSVTPASLVAGATGNVTVAFTTAGAVPTGGRVDITFPAGFNVAAATLNGSTNIAAVASIAVVGQVVTVNSNAAGNIIAAATAAQVVLAGVVNPTTAGVTGTFTITTFSAVPAAIDTVTCCAATIVPAAANKLAVTTQPSASTVAGVAFAQQPVVKVQDQFGNTRTADTPNVVAALTTGTGTLSGTTTKAAVAGVATFTDLSINLAGADKVLTFTSAGLTSALSSPAFTITAPPAPEPEAPPTSPTPTPTPSPSSSPAGVTGEPGIVATSSVPPPGGIGLLVTSGPTTTAQLITALAVKGCTMTSAAVLQSGAWRIYIPGAPAAVNATFPAQLAAATAFFVRC